MDEASCADRHLAFIGFGEAATAFLSGWSDLRPARISAYDRKSDDPAERDKITARYAHHAVVGTATAGEAVHEASIVCSTVTADQALAAAREAAPSLSAGALWFDCNSCAPDTKRKAAEVIVAAGGRYVDVAVMAPVHPMRHHVPLLISGPHAAAAKDVLRSLDMRPRIVGDEVGQASSIKMIRSILIKGMEALTTECFLAARRAGVDAEVIASLEASDPGMGWARRGAYNLERMMVHGARRAAEMREVAVTVTALGLPGRMSAAAAEWQDEIAGLGLEPGEDDLASRTDAVLSRL